MHATTRRSGEARLHEGEDDATIGMRNSDEHGEFELPWLRPARAYRLSLFANDYPRRSQALAARAAQAETEELVLRPAHDALLTFVTPDGEPLAGNEFELRDLRPDDARPEERAAVEALTSSRYLRTDGKGVLRLRDKPAGVLELGLQRHFALLGDDGTPRVDTFGHVQTERRVVHTWSLRIPPAEQRLEVDVSAWPIPGPPPLPEHVGSVVDAATGAPIGGGAGPDARAGGLPRVGQQGGRELPVTRPARPPTA